MIWNVAIENVWDSLFRPGGEITPGEDEIEGLKRAMSEVITTIDKQ